MGLVVLAGISTHALVQRAAHKIDADTKKPVISTHALVQRAALSAVATPLASVFQPTPSCRGRLTRGRNYG